MDSHRLLSTSQVNLGCHCLSIELVYLCVAYKNSHVVPCCNPKTTRVPFPTQCTLFTSESLLGAPTVPRRHPLLTCHSWGGQQKRPIIVLRKNLVWYPVEQSLYASSFFCPSIYGQKWGGSHLGQITQFLLPRICRGNAPNFYLTNHNSFYILSVLLFIWPRFDNQDGR